jgi:DedD protein
MASSPPSGSADSTLIRRARRRLIGSIALVLVAVIALPMIFDDEKKPLDQDVSVQIPSPDVVTVRPPAAPGGGKAVEPKLPPGQAAGAIAASPDAVQDGKAAPAKEQVERGVATADTKAASKAEKKVEPEKEVEPEKKPVPKSESKSESRGGAKADGRPAPKAEEVRVKAILDGAAGEVVRESGGFAVQIGAFASDEKVREARDKLSATGYKSFVEKLETKDGERTRVRAGPFGSREAAEVAREKIRGAGFSGATVVTR